MKRLRKTLSELWSRGPLAAVCAWRGEHVWDGAPEGSRTCTRCGLRELG